MCPFDMVSQWKVFQASAHVASFDSGHPIKCKMGGIVSVHHDITAKILQEICCDVTEESTGRRSEARVNLGARGRRHVGRKPSLPFESLNLWG